MWVRNQLSFPSSVPLLLAACIKLTGAENDLPVVQKLFMPQRLHLGNTGIHPLQPIDEASWIWHPECDPVPATARAEVFSSGWRQPVLLRFRQGFTAASASCRIHVSADERFELFVIWQGSGEIPARMTGCRGGSKLILIHSQVETKYPRPGGQATNPRSIG